MDAIEKENRTLKGVLPKDFARPALDKTRLGELIDLIGTIELVARDDAGLFGPKNRRSQDILGQVYMYFLGRFAAAEGKAGGEAFTPESIVKLLVEMIEPYKGRVGDWCCGSGGMFVQSEKFVEAHGGRRNDLSVFGQESNPTTWRLCRMNLAIRGIEANLGPHNADSFHNDLHKDVKADFILANPPFNVSDWGGDRLRDDPRWKYGVPPVGNANFAWVQLLIHHLAPNGVAGVVLANGSMSSNQSGEGEIRRAIVEADLVDCMIAMPGQLFYNTAIPVCLWFFARNKADMRFRDRRGQTLFIDARKLGRLVDRVHRELTDRGNRPYRSDIPRLARREGYGEYEDVPGFCKSAKQEEIAAHGFVLTPGRYVGAEDVEDDDEPFDEKMKRLVASWTEQFAEGPQAGKRPSSDPEGTWDMGRRLGESRLGELDLSEMELLVNGIIGSGDSRLSESQGFSNGVCCSRHDPDPLKVASLQIDVPKINCWKRGAQRIIRRTETANCRKISCFVGGKGTCIVSGLLHQRSRAQISRRLSPALIRVPYLRSPFSSVIASPTWMGTEDTEPKPSA